jgi:hypothetical protein
MSKVRTVAAAITLMLGASVSYAQSSYTPMPVFPSSESPGNVQFQNDGYLRLPRTIWLTDKPVGAMYVACWAEVPSNNTAYFSAKFAGPAVSPVRKQFRTFVTTHYGPVSKLQCAGKFSEAVLNEQVEKWKDSARTEKNAIVDT